jgi:hypothetical protein
MQLFGGDPRFVILKIVLDMNKWYFLLITCLFLCLLTIRADDVTFLFIFFLFTLVELFRLFLMQNFVQGEVPMFTASLALTVIPQLVVDFLWLFFVDSRNGFDYVAISGMIIFHVIEFCAFGIPQLLELTKYQTSFFRFQYGYRAVHRESDELELRDMSVHVLSR